MYNEMYNVRYNSLYVGASYRVGSLRRDRQ